MGPLPSLGRLVVGDGDENRELLLEGCGTQKLTREKQGCFSLVVFFYLLIGGGGGRTGALKQSDARCAGVSTASIALASSTCAARRRSMFAFTESRIAW